MKKLVVSELTKKIYFTNTRQVKGHPNLFEAIGEKQDYTDEAIRAVFEWFMANFEDNPPNETFEVTFGNCPYVLQMVRRNTRITEKNDSKE